MESLLGVFPRDSVSRVIYVTYIYIHILIYIHVTTESSTLNTNLWSCCWRLPDFRRLPFRVHYRRLRSQTMATKVSRRRPGNRLPLDRVRRSRSYPDCAKGRSTTNPRASRRRFHRMRSAGFRRCVREPPGIGSGHRTGRAPRWSIGRRS